MTVEAKVLTKLDETDRKAARDTVALWLDAWHRQAWGTMASQSQFPQSVGVCEPEICFQLEKRLEQNRLGSYVLGEMMQSHTDMAGTQRIAFADFSVVGIIAGTRIGIILRAVFNGKKWGVNYTSLNRRFDPDKKG
jgi:hypothetical protein